MELVLRSFQGRAGGTECLSRLSEGRRGPVTGPAARRRLQRFNMGGTYGEHHSAVANGILRKER